MTHKDALNMLLANSCSNPDYPDDGETMVMRYDLCCAVAVVKVKRREAFDYEIVSVEIESLMKENS